MSKKGVSAEEKRNRMMQLFYETGECYQLKELEKVAPKLKGITANSVKEVIQKLVDDGMVDTDKIGGSIYFWAFPSKAFKTKRKKLEELQKNYEEAVKKHKMIEEYLEQSKTNPDKAKNLNKIMEEIVDLELEYSDKTKKLKYYQENDPEKLKIMSNEIQILRDGANRWTDNIFEIKSWCKKKFFLEESVLNKQFGIPEDLDYIE